MRKNITHAAALFAAALVLGGFSNLPAKADAALNVNADTSALTDANAISPLLYGIFLEDINFAVDGGMYGELIKNGSFEYGMLAKNSGKHNYSLSDKETVSFDVIDGSEDGSCLNENNTHYAVITNSGDSMEGIGNKGYLKGFAVNEGEEYLFSAFLKGMDGYTGAVEISIVDKEDNVLATAEIPALTEDWTKYECTLTPSATSSNGLRFFVKIENGSAAADCISLFPSDTYKGRKNGIRRDIGEYLEALHPKFLRFPGGCAIEGTMDGNQYSWKDSIGNGLTTTVNGEEVVGDVSARPLGVDIWNNSTTNSLG